MKTALAAKNAEMFQNVPPRGARNEPIAVSGGYRSFTVAIAIAASMALMSQKRTTTCVSVQPLR